jgi:hypothetical protein
MHQDYLPILFGEKNKLQEHQSGHVVEWEKKWEKTKANAFMEVVYDSCGKQRPLHAYLYKASRGRRCKI